MLLLLLLLVNNIVQSPMLAKNWRNIQTHRMLEVRTSGSSLYGTVPVLMLLVFQSQAARPSRSDIPGFTRRLDMRINHIGAWRRQLVALRVQIDRIAYLVDSHCGNGIE